MSRTTQLRDGGASDPPRTERLHPCSVSCRGCPPSDTANKATRAAVAPTTAALAVEQIDSAETFEAISTPASDLIANGRLAKFLIDRRDPDAPRVRFVNGNFTADGETPDAARFHYFFGREAFGIPESLADVQRRHLLHPGQALRRRHGAHLLPRRRRPSRCTACSSTRRT